MTKVVGNTVRLSSEWQIGAALGGGGFGNVYEAIGGTTPAVIKLVPKQPGAARELLFADLGARENVVPVIDRGEFDDYLAIVMPRADYSLRVLLGRSDGAVGEGEAVAILKDIAAALVSLDGVVVHRDVKPENVLFLGGHWCLADFGISRYAEASTSLDTHKWSMTPQYAAPEQWRSERATGATDIYAFGVIAYELLAGKPPFLGPMPDDYREQHLHAEPAPIIGISSRLGDLVSECLFKASGARPTPNQVMTRLSRSQTTPRSAALDLLTAANHVEVQKRAAVARLASIEATESEQRSERAKAAKAILSRISECLFEAISGGAPDAKSRRQGDMWSISLGHAELVFGGPIDTAFRRGKEARPVFDVDMASYVHLQMTPTPNGYDGRSHSLWFGDIQVAGEYGWFETAFWSPLAQTLRQTPHVHNPDNEVAEALGNGCMTLQVVWPFTPIVTDDLSEFIERWMEWFAKAATRSLSYPSHMPERNARGSWRRK